MSASGPGRDTREPGQATSRAFDRLEIHGCAELAGQRNLPEEVPVALSFGGTTQAVMMATPSDLEDFGIGFALTERIARTASDILSMEIAEVPEGLDVQMRLAEDRQSALSARRRAMAGPVGCGLCGIESISEALRGLPALDATELTLSNADIFEAVGQLGHRQALRAQSGAVHAAGFYQPGEGLVLLREDVGRHNALDKLAGGLARDGRPAIGGAMVITSRVSVDMVQKAAIAGAPVLIALSVPTALAVRVAQSAGLTLIAMARSDRFEIFSRPDRVGSTTGKRPDVA